MIAANILWSWKQEAIVARIRDLEGKILEERSDCSQYSQILEARSDCSQYLRYWREEEMKRLQPISEIFEARRVCSQYSQTYEAGRDCSQDQR